MYEALEEGGASKRSTGRRNRLLMLAGAFLGFGGLCAIVGMAAHGDFSKKSSAHIGPDGKPYDRQKRYTVPDAYTAEVSFSLPYISLEERVHVHVDQAAGAMRLGYYSGADTFILHKDKPSYEIVPVITTLTCLETQPQDLSHVFPDLSLFELDEAESPTTVTTATHPDGVDCDTWTYTTPSATADANGNATARLPVNGGYAGSYKFYVDADNGNPVQLAFVGHNVVLGGSHYDQYIVNYLSVHEHPEGIEKSWFEAPFGMVCEPSDQPFGPTVTGHHKTFRNPLTDITMLFPGEKSQRLRDEHFAAFEKKHGRRGGGDEEEREQRKTLFQQNLRYVHAANRRGLSYHLATNHLSDRTAAEKARLLGRKQETEEEPQQQTNGKSSAAAQKCGTYEPKGGKLPDSVDWRSVKEGGNQPGDGYVLKAPDQGTCGSCWSFGATGAIEGALVASNHSLVATSQQNMMDCSWKFGNNACDGGLDYLGYEWMLNNNKGQIATDESYGGYLNQDGFCHFDLTLPKEDMTRKIVTGATITGCTQVVGLDKQNTTSAAEATARLNDALAHIGPVAVSVDAGPNGFNGTAASTPQDFYYYAGGYYHNPLCGNRTADLDHSVLAVAYHTVKGQKYTTIRNSWSQHWGMNGYMHISQEGNTCGVATSPTFVTVAAK